MVYSKKHPALLIMGIILLAIGFLTDYGAMDVVISHLKTKKMVAEMTTLPYIFGTIAVVVGLWQLLGSQCSM